MAEHIRDRIKAALHLDRHSQHDSGEAFRLIFEMLLLMEEQQHAFFAFAEKHLHTVERMERHIMAQDDAIFAQFTQMAADVDELNTAVASLQAQIAAGNDQGATDEANKIEAALSPLADSLRAAAAKFDPSTPPTPTPEPTPEPDQARRPKHR